MSDMDGENEESEDSEDEDEQYVSMARTDSGPVRSFTEQWRHQHDQEMDRRREELAMLHQTVEEKAEEIERLREKWEVREEELRSQAEQAQASIEAREKILWDLILEHHAETPTGPHALRFVEGNVFNGVVAGVILINLISMTVCLTRHSEESMEVLRWEQALDRVFVAFYLVEVLLRWGYWGKAFLIGNLKFVWWNWLDVLLVVDGLLYAALELEGSQASWAGCLQYLRALRYLRIAKLAHAVWGSNLAWTESEGFHFVVMVVICANALVMGAEVEYPSLQLIWQVSEHAFLLFFTFELSVRLKYAGCWSFFTDPDYIAWNLLDSFIVVGGIIEQWVLPISFSLLAIGGSPGHASGGSMASLLRLIRICRLLRILRLLRLIKNVPPLYSLIVGIVKAMQGMSWVMMLTVVVLYISALLGVKLVGPRGLLIIHPEQQEGALSRVAARLLKGHAAGGMSHCGGHPADESPESQLKEVTSCFPNMFDAVFNMFKVMQMDLEPMEPLFEWSPASKYVIMFYVVVTNWAIFSILTAVVSDEMAKVTNQLEEEEASKTKSKLNEQLVEKIFFRLSAQHGGEVTRAQFMQLLKDPDEKEELCQAAGLEEDDLKEFFEILCVTKQEAEDDPDSPKTQVITKQDFLKGLEKERDSVNQRAMMKLESRMDVMDQTIHKELRRLQDVIENKLHMSVIPVPTSDASPLTGCSPWVSTNGHRPSFGFSERSGPLDALTGEAATPAALQCSPSAANGGAFTPTVRAAAFASNGGAGQLAAASALWASPAASGGLPPPRLPPQPAESPWRTTPVASPPGTSSGLAR